jgi:hypothetical protein
MGHRQAYIQRTWIYCCKERLKQKGIGHLLKQTNCFVILLLVLYFMSRWLMADEWNTIKEHLFKIGCLLWSYYILYLHFLVIRSWNRDVTRIKGLEVQLCCILIYNFPSNVLTTSRCVICKFVLRLTRYAALAF